MTRSTPRHVSPGEYPLWDRALALVNRDLAATLPAEEPLRLLAVASHSADESEDVYVALSNGEWHGNRLYPDSAHDEALALAVVADAAQTTVTERLWRAWPLCAEHDLGMHPRAGTDGRLSWWCAGGRRTLDPGHIRAAVGALDTLIRPRRPNRKKKRTG
jgi:hypothetical protein